MNRGIHAFVLSAGLAACPLALPAQSVSLVWDPSTNATVAGYMLYYGSDGIHFDKQMDSGTNISATVTGLQAGTTNFFEVVAYDGNKNQSPPSNLLEYTVPANGTPAPNGGQNGITNAVAAIAGNSGASATSPIKDNTNCIPNPFHPVAATYHGLVYVTGNAAEESSGSFIASVTRSGVFSATFRQPGQGHSFAGKFSASGAAFKSIPRPGRSPLTVQLQLDSTNGPLTGTISDGNWTADLVADAAVYSKANPAPQAGKYTLLIPGSEYASAQPGGNGFGTVTVTKSGSVVFNGFLGDGTVVTSASIVSSQGQWPFYVSLYGGKGSMLGWLSFSNGGDISGQTGWFKLPAAMAKLYPDGFTNSPEVIGSVYWHTNGLPVPGFTGGQLSLTNGNLAQAITNQIADKLAFNTSSGMFSASVMNPATGKRIPVKGIVLQNQGFGAGFFLGTTESGSALLSPAQ